MVEAVDSGVGHYCEARVDGFTGVVEDGVVVWLTGEAEAGEALLGAVEDEICAVWEGDYIGQKAF